MQPGTLVIRLLANMPKTSISLKNRPIVVNPGHFFNTLGYQIRQRSLLPSPFSLFFLLTFTPAVLPFILFDL